MAPTTRSNTAPRPAAAPSARLAAKITAADLARIAPAPRAAPTKPGMQKQTTGHPAQDPAPDAPSGAAPAAAVIAGLADEVQRLGGIIGTLRQEVEDLQAGAEESGRRLKRIAEELEESERDRAGAEQELREEREAHASTLKALSKKTEERMELCLQLGEARVQINRLQEEGAATRAVLATTREAQAQSSLAHVEAAETIMRLTDELEKVKRDAAAAAPNRCGGWCIKCAEQQAELTMANEARCALQRRLSALEKHTIEAAEWAADASPLTWQAQAAWNRAKRTYTVVYTAGSPYVLMIDRPPAPPAPPACPK